MNTEDNKVLLWSWVQTVYADHNLVNKPHSFVGVDAELRLEPGTTLALLPDVLREFNSRYKGSFGNKEIVFMGERLFVLGNAVIPAPIIVAEKMEESKNKKK